MAIVNGVPCANTTVQGCRNYVQQRRNFATSNKQLYGYSIKRGETVLFVVWSYGYHWPLFVYREGVWFANEDKYGPTTSKHCTKSHPHENCHALSLTAIKRLVDGDESVIAGLVQEKAA